MGPVEIYVRSLTVLGYPIGTVPLGIIGYNGHPFGLAIIAKAGREDLILAFMGLCEAISEKRSVPVQLVS